MTGLKSEKFDLSDNELDFVIQEAAPQFGDKDKLKRLIREDEDFRKALVGDEKVFQRIISDENIFLRISPSLYFEILLRKTQRELERASHTVEKVGGEQVPVFDVKEVVDLLTRDMILEYMAHMLSSFTKVESYSMPVRVRKGVWRKVRFNDMDIDVLNRLCGLVGEEERLSLYKRIADVCLFILGIFPEYAQFDYKYTSSDKVLPKVRSARRSVQEYEEEGKKFYKLAAEHDSAKMLELSEVFWLLHENFNIAKKPLNFIAQHYLHNRKQRLFGISN